ncbi:MAG: SirB2 family protein [Limnohabitans sp.]
MPAWLYPRLLDVHRACVAASVALFVARGLGVSALHRWPMRPLWRRLSVGIDVLLLAAGVSLWTLLNYHPLQPTWLGVKLALLVIYIVLGSYALQRGRTRALRFVFFLAALAVVFSMAGIALHRHPAGWWAPSSA